MLQELASSLGMTDIPESWQRNYDYALTTLPEQIEFIQPEFLVHLRKRMVLSEENAAWVRDALEFVRGNEQLRRLAWLWHCILYRRPDPERERITLWPVPDGMTGSGYRLEAVFPAVVLLSGYRRLEAMYLERNVPEEIIVDTLSAVETCMEIYEERYGFKGLGMHYLNWLQYCFNAQLYKIGRLEYEMRIFAHAILVYRHMKDGSVVILSKDGVKYRGDGLVDGTNAITDEMTGWTATLTETEDEIIGYAIHPDGYAVQERKILRRDEWQLVLAPGDMTINVHIPRKGEFTKEVCQESFVRAVQFFETCYPERSFPALTCFSWLMDPQLQQLLAPKSNLVQFQKWYHLFPLRSGDEGLYSFVFMCEKCEVDQLPEKTSLQRKIKRFMQAGGHMHNGGGILLVDTIRAL